jgi:hypothetical protein
MVQSASELIAKRKAQTAPPVVVTPQEEGLGFFGSIGDFFTGESRKTEATRTLPEIGSVSSGGFSSDLQIGAGLLTTLNPKAQMDIIVDAVPGTTFEQDEQGNNIVIYPTGEKAILNKPGASFQDAVQLSAQVLSFIPAARLASFGKGVLAKVALGGSAAGLTDVIQQETSQALGSEQPFDPLQTALTTGLGAGAELIAPAFTGARNLMRERKFNLKAAELNEARPAVQSAQESVEELAKISPTGERVGLTQAQQTQVPSTLIQQRAVAEIPAGSKIAIRTLEKQNKEVSAAVNDVLNTVADAKAVERGAEGFREASLNAIKAQENIRKEAASPIYKRAFDEAENNALVIPLNGLKSLITNISKRGAESGQVQSTMRKTSKLLEGEKYLVDGEEVFARPTLEKLHNAKLEIDEMIAGQTKEKIGPTVKAKLLEVQERLVHILRESSDAYKEASETFAELSPAVDALKNSIIGKASNISDDQLKNLSKRVFDASETNPEVIRNAKKVIFDTDPNAWNDLLRSELGRRIGKINTNKLGIPNTPSDLERAIFGTNDAQANVLFEAASPQLKANLKHLRVILKRAKEGRPGGSDTAAKLDAKEARSIGRILGLIFSPFKSAKDIGRQQAQLNKDAAIATALFDTKFITNINKLQKLNPDSPAFARAMAQLLNKEDE